MSSMIGAFIGYMIAAGVHAVIRRYPVRLQWPLFKEKPRHVFTLPLATTVVPDWNDFLKKTGL